MSTTRVHLTTLLISLGFRLHSLILVPVIVSQLGFSALGDYAFISALGNQLVSLAGLGYGFTFRRNFNKEADFGQKQRLFYNRFYMGAAITFIIAVFGAVFISKSRIFSDHGNPLIFTFIALVFSKFLLNHGADYFRYSGRIVHSSILSLFVTYSGVCALFLASRMNLIKGVTGIIAVDALFATIGFFIVGYYIIREMGIKFSRYTRQELRKDFKLSSLVNLRSFIEQLLFSVDRYIIGYVLGGEILGQFTALKTIASLPLAIVTPSSNIVFPLLSKFIDSGDRREAGEYLAFVRRIIYFFSIPFVFGCFLLGPELVGLWVGPISLKGASGLMAIFAFGTVVFGQMLLNVQISDVYYDTKNSFLAMLMSVVVYGLISILFLTEFKQLISVPIGYTIGVFSGLAWLHIKNRKHAELSSLIRGTMAGRILIASLGMSLTIIIVREFAFLDSMFSTLGIFLGNVGMAFIAYIIILVVLRFQPAMLLSMRIDSPRGRNFYEKRK